MRVRGPRGNTLLVSVKQLNNTVRDTMGKRKLVSTRESSDNDDNLPRSAANARERTRMRVLSKSFERLKLMLPW